MADKKIPTNRFSRLARVGGAAASQAVKQTGTRAANIARSEEKGDAAMERRQIEAAKQIVTVLGGMKGAAMKVGQVLSFMDVGLVPEQYREEFQAELAKLRDAAPTVSFDQMRVVIEDDLDAKLSETFSDFDDEPIAAASIGQVYRATLTDGRDVAVKVQYPGINDAVRADMKNLGILMRLVKRITPQMDVQAVAGEIRERIVEELDYELEASNQRTMARIYREHPFIVVPEVVTSLSRERVIVSELVAGDGFEAIRAEDDAERDRIGEIVFRFYYGSMFRHHRFSGDPHPGNMIRQPDGTVAFLDFGLFKAVDPEITERELACQRAVIEEDPERLHRLLTEYGFIPEPEKLDPGGALGLRARGHLVVHPGRERAARPEDRLQGRDRDHRPPRPPLPRDAAPGHRPRAPLRPPPRAAHAGGARHARGRGQLASDRPRVDLRRRAGHRARSPGGGVPGALGGAGGSAAQL